MNLLPEQQQEMQQEIQRVIRLIQQFQLSKNFTEFETIKLPFELVELGVILWKMSFTAEILQQVADRVREFSRHPRQGENQHR